jgi:hypothetical protein
MNLLRRTRIIGTGGTFPYANLCFLFTVFALLISCSSGPPSFREREEQRQMLLPPRPVHFDVAQPYPISVPADEESWRPYLINDTTIPLIISVDISGDVTEIQPVRSEDTAFADYYERRMMAARFEPGIIDGKISAFRIPVKLRFRPYAKPPHFLYPVGRRREISNSWLYFQCLELNGLSLSAINSFPSYTSSVSFIDSLNQPPFVLAEIDLDSAGRPTRINVRHASSYVDMDQIVSAMNWAEYSPASRMGVPVSSKELIAIFLFSEISYPTRTLLRSDLDSVDIRDRLRVQFVQPGIGFMLPPVPRNTRNGYFTPGGNHDLRRTRISARVFIDTLGQTSFLSTDRKGRWIGKNCRAVLEHLRFYPALDFEGNPQRFSGLVFVDFTDSKTVRIQCEWLSRPVFLPSDQLIE